jgi:hypothetical protein
MTAERNDLLWAYVKAASPLTDTNTLAMLSFCKWTPIRRRVAANYRTPTSVLAVLSVDPEADVRLAVACNPAASTEVIDRLLAGMQPAERLEVARTPDTSRYALESLSNDPANNVRAAADLTIRLFYAPGTRAERPLPLPTLFAPGQFYPPDLPMYKG